MKADDPRCEENKLVLLAMAGDASAFEALVRIHQLWLVRLLRRLTGDPVHAEDVAQVSLIKAWTNLHRLEKPHLFRAWLRTIAARAAIDAARSRRPTDTSLDAAHEEVDPDSERQRSEQRLDIEAALLKLSVAQRACVLLSYGEGMSHMEVAKTLAMPIGTVKSHLARAAPLLRAALADWRGEHGR